MTSDAAVMSKPDFAGHAVEASAQTDRDVAQGSVVDVEHSAPGDVVEVKAEFVAVEQVGVEHRRAQVVGRGHCVHVTGQVEVELFHRDDLAIATAGRAAFDTEGWPHRRLPQCDGGLLADVAKALAEADGGCRLTFAKRRGGDGRDDDVLGLGPVFHCLDGIE